MSNLDDINQLHQLYDIYGPLLTEKQQDYFELYYFEDLSLAEIAEELGISRNAVHNNLQSTIAHLNNYEVKLKIVETKSNLMKSLDSLEAKDKITKEDIEKLKNLL